MNLIAQLDDYCQKHDGERQLPSDYRTEPFGVFETKRSKVAAGYLSNPSTTAGVISIDPPQRSGSIAQAPDAGTPDVADQQDTDPFADVETEPLISIPEDPPSNESSIEEMKYIRHHHMFNDTDDRDEDMVHAVPQQVLWQFDDLFSFLGDFGLPLEIPGGQFTSLDLFDVGPSTIGQDGFAGLFDNIDQAPKHQAPIPKTHSDWDHLMSEAPALLRCYQTGSEASEPAKQTFWKSFVLPLAMRTFAELSVFGKASDVSSSVFYSTLANSAFAMQRSDPLPPNDSHWYEIGKNAEEAGQYFLQCALRSEADQTDCQELLSATLSLALVSVSSFLCTENANVHPIKYTANILSSSTTNLTKPCFTCSRLKV
jgi:hypothetical protein